jgi:hypothetical protein
VDVIMLRSLERITSVLIGGLSIYLGFRLFLEIPQRSESEGKFVLPGGISVYLTRVGPGVFFALFGAVIVATSFHQAITYKESAGTVTKVENRQASPEKHSELPAIVSKEFVGLGGAAGNDDLGMRRLAAAQDIRFLNGRSPTLI